MSITDPEHRFRVMIKLWGGNYKGEQPFYSAPQKNLLEVVHLVRQIQAGPVHHQIRSYVIHEELSDNRWQELDYSDWCDL